MIMIELMKDEKKLELWTKEQKLEKTQQQTQNTNEIVRIYSTEHHSIDNN